MFEEITQKKRGIKTYTRYPLEELRDQLRSNPFTFKIKSLSSAVPIYMWKFQGLQGHYDFEIQPYNKQNIL